MKELGNKSVVGEVAVVGAGARLPGASDIASFWNVLKSGRNTVSDTPKGRWSVGRFLRPGEPQPGFAYTFAGGYLADPFAFDPALFGISHREARQMDPQQRMLLEVTWSALEDANIPASSLSGQNVGVYIGASNVDYQSSATQDPSLMESHYMTGNSLSILSNRLSHAFDLRGPSFTVDSACSSSFVALNEAMAALNDGRIDLAIVGGVNLLLSPAPFVGFSQAHMLSPTGRCRPFSEEADGYVRSEGAVVVVLRRLKDARSEGNAVRGILLGSSANSDGYTPGISLPSMDGQKHLLQSLYADLGLHPDKLAFVEAHGTGTKAGDPIEARAIGESLGMHRSRPLPIGSAKSNVGHLECVSGLVGLLKSCLSLQNHLLPRSVFSERLNDAIPFADMNLAVAQQDIKLERQPGQDRLIAGICNYGFGGTNAHVVVAEGDPAVKVASVADQAKTDHSKTGAPQVIAISAATKEALKIRSAQIAQVLANGARVEDVANALGHRRDLLPHRLVVPISTPAAVSASLQAVAEDMPVQRGIATAATWEKSPVAFVFTGNGCQFRDMGQLAYKKSAIFREEIQDIDQLFKPLSGWSIADTIEHGVEPERLALTSISQPLIYAIQSALVTTFARFGIKPDVVFGHSMGEVAAAEACGALSRKEAVKVIYLRSHHQEYVRGHGTMLVVATTETRIAELLEQSGISGVEIAAINGPNSLTVSGPSEALLRLAKECSKNKIATVKLDIQYPFHSSALDPYRDDLVKDLSGIMAGASSIPFLSTVVGAEIDGEQLTGHYWWQNIRNPVQFRLATEKALERHIHCFVEIGPKPILSGPIKDTLRAHATDSQFMNTLSDKDQPDADPIMQLISRFIAMGMGFSTEAAFGAKRPSRVSIPPYPMQRNEFTLGGTSEGLLAFGKMTKAPKRHALLGDRMASGSPEWRSLLDPAILPFLEDHQVDGAVVVPASGLVEMALQVGREIYGDKPFEVSELDVFKALAIMPGEIREVSTIWADQSHGVEIWSRKRFSTNSEDWILHARGTIATLSSRKVEALLPPVADQIIRNSHAEVYEEATRAGLEYGPKFRRVESIERDDVTTDSRLSMPDAVPEHSLDYMLHPISFDAALHGLFISRPQKDGETKAYMPVRIRNVRVWEPGVAICRSITLLTNETERFKTVAVSLFSATGALVASVDAVVLRAVYLSRATIPDRTFRTEIVALQRPDLSASFAAIAADMKARPVTEAAPWLLTRAFCVSLAQTILRNLAQDGAEGSPEDFVKSGHIVPEAVHYLTALNQVLSEFVTASDSENTKDMALAMALPSPHALLATLINRFPSANMEIRLAADALEHAERYLRTGQQPATTSWLLQRFESETCLAAPAVRALADVLTQLTRSATQPLRVLALEPFGPGLVKALAELADAGRIEVTFCSKTAADIDAQRQEFRADSLINRLVLKDEIEEQPVAFDVLVSFAASLVAGNDRSLFTQALGLMKTAAPIIIAAPGTDSTLDMLRGLWNLWLEPMSSGEVAGRTPSVEAVKRQLRKIGVENIDSCATDNGQGNIVFGRAPVREFDKAVLENLSDVGRIALVVDQGQASLAADFLQFIETIATGAQPEEALLGWLDQAGTDEALTLILAPHATEHDALDELAHRIEYLRAILECIEASGKTVRLFVLTEAMTADTQTKSGLERAIQGFVRVAINEYPNIDLRLIHLLPGADIEVIAKVIAVPGPEKEWQIDGNGASVLRVRRGIMPPKPLEANNRSVLRFEYPGRLDSFVWTVAERRELAVGEIEVQVAAVGLNFRDVLVGLGILDDDLLGAGLTAASLGFECSGTVARIGPGVSRFKIGDRVMGFAKDAFTSHVVTPAWYFHQAPTGIDLEAAATIPVAFVTAWYALVERAHLKKGEDVLIHGGAGGVGQAAIQIARNIGARIFTTASSPMRQRIARVAGADLLFDSRQERFADAIRSEYGGVDVVLNSLAGKGMLESFKLMKPFGRFIELGKRDFLENTTLGLRPFVRNLQYSGVDLDELLGHDRGLVESMLAKISEAFSRRELVPLTYQVLEGFEVGRAFRALQGSEHIGKIVVKPPALAREDVDQLVFTAKPGTYVVIGGAGGFGFSTARWLAKKGATKLVLASRRGVVEPELVAQVNDMRAQGVEVITMALDVRDADAVKAFVDTVRSQHGEIRGVIHTAVALDDGLISGLTSERLRGVLGAKVDGVLNLDAALSDVDLDFFVVYSSATTVIGSPGQGAYVAANAFLEGFMEKRRALGKPGLAIGWGAISDAGIIARDKSLADRLRRTTGVVGIRASEALAQLGRLLALGNAAAPIQFYSNISPSEAAGKLALINSPTYAGLGLVRAQEGVESGDDIATAIAGETPEKALEIVIKIMRREVAQILRMPESQIDSDRQMGELGLDSLMALELQLGIERLAGVQVPLVGINNRRLSDVAAMVLHHMGVDLGSSEDEDLELDDAMRMTEMHVTDSASTEEIAKIKAHIKSTSRLGAAE
ncbi:type I polyketide synthase [Rhizobium oryziradicis]|nr:type I polyketide synthase [Rhizobium oryziradicis]